MYLTVAKKLIRNKPTKIINENQDNILYFYFSDMNEVLINKYANVRARYGWDVFNAVIHFQFTVIFCFQQQSLMPL